MTPRVVEAVSAAERERAFEIRRAVFCDEQKVSREEEFDGLDDSCRHYLAVVSALGVGAARTRRLSTGEIKIERVAVLQPFRGIGIGRALMRKVMEDVGDAPMTLNAQFQTKGFYKALGFSAVGDIFVEAGIDHVKMVRRGPVSEKFLRF